LLISSRLEYIDDVKRYLDPEKFSTVINTMSGLFEKLKEGPKRPNEVLFYQKYDYLLNKLSSCQTQFKQTGDQMYAYEAIELYKELTTKMKAEMDTMQTVKLCSECRFQ
jgi:FKBP12-rapamycin binding domain